MCGCDYQMPATMFDYPSCVNCYWNSEENKNFHYTIVYENIFTVIYTAFLENIDTILAESPNLTPGKIVEKIWHTYNIWNMYEFLADDVLMGRVMFEMYEKVLEDESAAVNAVKRIVF